MSHRQDLFDHLQVQIRNALRGAGLSEDVEFTLERPKDRAHGDLASNVALLAAQEAGASPRDLAEALKRKLNLDPTTVESAEVAGPGFVNFRVSPAYLRDQVEEILDRGVEYGRTAQRTGEQIVVEFVSSNPTGPLHVGHGRQAALGDTIVTLLEAVGHRVTREYYFNDAGRQMELLGRSLWARYEQLFGRNVSVPGDGYQGDYLIPIAEALKEKVGERYLDREDPETLEAIRRFGVDRIVKTIRSDLDALSVRFDVWYLETSLYESGRVEETLKIMDSLGLTYQKDGAVWFRASEYGDSEDRVLVKSTGEPTYFLPDLAYHIDKRERGFDRAINIWGADHHGYVPRMKAAMRALGYPEEFLTCIVHQLVTLQREGRQVKTSTRKGEFVTLRELLDTVGPDAVRYFMLTRRADAHLVFDIDLALRRTEENPVYYIQYAHARIASIFSKAGAEPRFQEYLTAYRETSLDSLETPWERALMTLLMFYPWTVRGAAEALEPHRLPAFLEEVARAFHLWYQHCRVLSEDRGLSLARLKLARATQQVIANGLGLLGVSAPTSM